jgi:hypothetical protein
MLDATWPLIISAGGSQQSKQWYSTEMSEPADQIKLTADVVTEHLAGYLIDLSLSGASNKRHVRRAIVECINQRLQNPTQRIILLLELTFDLRKELWIDEYQSDNDFEANFFQTQLATDINWWKDRGNNISDARCARNWASTNKKYLDNWISSQRFFYSPYAENINLYQEIFLLTCFLQKYKIDYIIYRGNPVEDLEPTPLIDFFKQELNKDPGVLNIEKFSFTRWCLDNNFKPIEKDLEYLEVGHPPVEGHRMFAESILLPTLSQYLCY